MTIVLPREEIVASVRTPGSLHNSAKYPHPPATQHNMGRPYWVLPAVWLLTA